MWILEVLIIFIYQPIMSDLYNYNKLTALTIVTRNLKINYAMQK